MNTFADIAPRIAKLLRLLASDKPGEVAASAQALRRVLGSANLDLHDLANVVEFSARREAPQVALATADDDAAREMIKCCCEYSDLLSAKELAFVRSMTKWHGQPTERRMAWLSSLYERCKFPARQEAPRC
jgi:hypothetical protein